MTEPGTDTPLAGLTARPHAYDAATGIRIAQRAAAQSDLALLITSSPGQTPATAPLQSVTETPQAIVVDTSVMGIFGALSPLPQAYNDLAVRDRRQRAGGLSSFVDIFTDRLTHLFVAAVEKYDITRQLQWSFQSDRSPRIVRALRSLVGLGTPEMAELSPLPGDETLRYAGLLAQQTRSANGLTALVSAELGLPVRVEQFHGRWRDLPQSEETRMDGSAQLGVNAGAGRKVLDLAGQIRLVVGPIRYGDFLSLEEGQPRLARLRRLIRFYIGPVLDFEIQIVLDRRDIPETRIGGDGPAPRLGWNTWARNLPAAQDSDEAIVGSAPRHRSADALEARP
ncbi:type VI secretion system baseplate subunit TssG [uncultured Roseobacter sp.]|uniref:type VI secretion system baseplate subunit TssG n=1 Tax=uncultured Roseobacter sp. TaxID=114847 RepID=UPI00263843ED|nr:type VI secretion system baseplate subunit TssG [uncultured Roseobacter sp.]